MKSTLPFFLLILSFTSVSGQESTQQYASVHSTVENYFIGWKAKDVSLLKEIFHDSSTLKFIDRDSTYQNVPIQQHIKDITTQSASFLPPHHRDVINIHTFNNGASAVVKLSFNTFEVTDFFQLLKIGNQWKIVSKVSVSRPLSKDFRGR